MDFVSKTRNCVSKRRNCVSKTKNCVLKMMNFAGFANQIFEPIWNKDHIESVEITFKEDIGTGLFLYFCSRFCSVFYRCFSPPSVLTPFPLPSGGRGGYFDGFGIIRDIMQNHLLQVFMFLTIEPPEDMTGHGITAAKVDLL